MNVEALREHCLRKKGVTEGFPFDNETLVFKVMGKIFALLPLENADRVNLKCDPDYAQELRAKYPEDVLPGYHMNKKHWNTVMLQGQLTERLLHHLVNHSYELVVSKLKKADRERLKGAPPL